MKPNYKLTKFTCFFLYPALAPTFILPPILFVIFRQMYGISYTLLGTLVFVNFGVQLAVDLFFSLCKTKFDYKPLQRGTPLLATAGLLIYGLVPTLLPQYAYAGLILGTVLFSIASGLNEVFLSPTLVAISEGNSEKDMSIMHSLYGYGCAAVALLSTVFLYVFGTESWLYLVLFWAVMPLVAFILFCFSPLPDIVTSEPTSQRSAKQKRIGLALCMVCIFLGSAAENTMTNWVSVYMERTLQIPKSLGDTLGLTAFALLLALTRTVYAKYGRNIYKVLMAGMIGAVVCYLAAGISSSGIVAIASCMLAGICTSMLWPGTLMFMEEKFPNPGVAAYALMAAGGDLGASVAPQGLGIVADTVAASNWASVQSLQSGLSTEQIGIKVGMLCTVLFPLAGILLLLYMKKFFSKINEKAAD